MHSDLKPEDSFNSSYYVGISFIEGFILWGGGGGGNSHRLGYGMYHFLRVLFWLKNKFLGLFYSF